MLTSNAKMVSTASTATTFTATTSTSTTTASTATASPSRTLATTTFTSTSKMSTYQTTIPFDTTRPETELSINSAVPTSINKESDGRVLMKPITFGGKGKSPGKFQYPNAVAVSAENEIYVLDVDNRRIQVFNKNGVFLRLFKTVYEVPGKEKQTIHPYDVAIDANGFVWVVGDIRDELQVVQYSQIGQQMSTVDPKSTTSFPAIAVNVLNGNIAVVTKGNTIFVFLPDGSVYNRFQLVGGVDVSFVTFNNEGNILFTDAMRNTVHEYTRDGDKLFQFGSKGRGEGQLRSPARICTDSSGNIFVSNMRNKRFDMFTSRGEFVRTVFSTKSPVGLACGPDGQLVVTDARSHSVTIIPRQLVLSG
ncbi:E3 ubiquitin-protein ligase TRIM32-like [Branchiostoma floridae x Branchiostoma japonicum]